MATLKRDERVAGICAMAAFAIFTVGNLLWALDQPAPDSTGAELVDFYKDSSGRIVAGGSLSLVSIALLIVVGAALSRVLEARLGDDLLGKVVFGGLVLGCAAGLGAETINMAAAIRADDGALTEPLAEALFDVSYMFGSYAGGVGFGLATLGIGLASRRTPNLLPGWLAIIAVVVGVALITPLMAYLIGEYAVGPAFLLLLVLGIRLMDDGSQSPESPPD